MMRGGDNENGGTLVSGRAIGSNVLRLWLCVDCQEKLGRLAFSFPSRTDFAQILHHKVCSILPLFQPLVCGAETDDLCPSPLA